MARRVRLGEIDVPGFYPRDELLALYETAYRLTGHIVEIGSYKGRSLAAIALAAPNATVWSIDPHEGLLTGAGNPNGDPRRRPRVDPSEAELRRTVSRLGLANVRIIVGRSTDSSWFVNRPIELLHIDGDHARGAPLADFEHYEPHLPPGAFVAFHDYRSKFPGVPEAVDQLVAEGRLSHVRTVHTLWIGLRTHPASRHD